MNTLIEAGLCVLAGFGLVALIVSLGYRYLAFSSKTGPGVSLIIVFRDKENIAEGLLRAILNLKALYDHAICDVVAVDDGSQDNTLSILERLERQFDSLKVVRKTDFSEQVSAVDAGIGAARNGVSLLCDARGAIDVAESVNTLFGLLLPTRRPDLNPQKDN